MAEPGRITVKTVKSHRTSMLERRVTLLNKMRKAKKGVEADIAAEMEILKTELNVRRPNPRVSKVGHLGMDFESKHIDLGD